MKDYVDVLGTRYAIEIHVHDEDRLLSEKHLDGYCSDLDKRIVLSDMSGEDFKYMTDTEKENLQKITVKHELLHAFLGESGLCSSANVFNGAWTNNEEMIDYFANQFHKIAEAYQWLEVL